MEVRFLLISETRVHRQKRRLINVGFPTLQAGEHLFNFSNECASPIRTVAVWCIQVNYSSDEGRLNV